MFFCPTLLVLVFSHALCWHWDAIPVLWVQGKWGNGRCETALNPSSFLLTVPWGDKERGESVHTAHNHDLSLYRRAHIALESGSTPQQFTMCIHRRYTYVSKATETSIWYTIHKALFYCVQDIRLPKWSSVLSLTICCIGAATCFLEVCIGPCLQRQSQPYHC